MLNKLFFKTNMTWKKVIVFALITAVYTATVLVIPFTIHSSLVNTGTTLEAWVLFALIIIMNCEKPIEASAKTFVFFLISQPLIYLFQVPFSYLGWQIFMFYPKWFIFTLLTIPGAFIAWFIKKDNILSSLILSAATAYLAFQAVYFIPSLINNFPKNLLSVIFCICLAYVLIFALLKKKINRIISIIITTLSLLGSIYYFLF